MQGRGYAIAGARRPLPGPWVAGTWTRSPAGVWTNTPRLGGNLLTDPSLEATYTAGKCNTLTGAGLLVSQSADVHTGSKAQQMQADTGKVLYWPSVTIAAGSWIKAGIWAKRLTNNNGFCRGKVWTSGGMFYYPTKLSSADYVQQIWVYRATTTGNSLQFGEEAASPNFDVVIFDDGSLEVFNQTDLIAFCNYGRQVNIAAALTMTAGIPGGVVSRLSVNGDGTINCVMCWHDGTLLHLDTIVNSYTVVSKVASAAAYGAGKAPKINFPSSNVAQALYGPLGSEVQIGTDQDISAVPAGTWAGLFSTDSTVSLGDPVIT